MDHRAGTEKNGRRVTMFVVHTARVTGTKEKLQTLVTNYGREVRVKEGKLSK